MKEQQVRMKGSVGLAAPGGRLPPNSNRWSLLQSKLYNGHNRCEEVWGWRSPLPCPPLSPPPSECLCGLHLPAGNNPHSLQQPPPLPPSECRLQDLVVPTLEPGSQGFVDLGFTTDGALLPETSRVWQFSFTPIKAENVGPTGEEGGEGRCGSTTMVASPSELRQGMPSLQDCRLIIPPPSPCRSARHPLSLHVCGTHVPV